MPRCKGIRQMGAIHQTKVPGKLLRNRIPLRKPSSASSGKKAPTPRVAGRLHPGGTKFISQNSDDTLSRAGAKIWEAPHFLSMHRPHPPDPQSAGVNFVFRETWSEETISQSNICLHFHDGYSIKTEQDCFSDLPAPRPTPPAIYENISYPLWACHVFDDRSSCSWIRRY